MEPPSRVAVALSSGVGNVQGTEAVRHNLRANSTSEAHDRIRAGFEHAGGPSLPTPHVSSPAARPKQGNPRSVQRGRWAGQLRRGWLCFARAVPCRRVSWRRESATCSAFGRTLAAATGGVRVAPPCIGGRSDADSPDPCATRGARRLRCTGGGKGRGAHCPTRHGPAAAWRRRQCRWRRSAV